MRRTAFAIRYEKTGPAGGYFASHHRMRLIPPRRCSRVEARRVLKRGVKMRGVWARITNGELLSFAYTARPNFKMWSSVTHMFDAVRMAFGTNFAAYLCEGIYYGKYT